MAVRPLRVGEQARTALGTDRSALYLSCFKSDSFTVIPSARLQATLDLLSDVERSARPADAVTSGWFRAHREIGDEDRGAILELIYTLLRHRARLGWWLARLGAG